MRNGPNIQLPPHLREVCALLAISLLRLHSHTAVDLARDAQRDRALGEISLHFRALQSGPVASPTRSPT